MTRALMLSAAALIGGMLAAPGTPQAQQTIDSLGLTVTTTPALTSDYMFRGISQTRSQPAIQATVDVEHASGLYIGTFVSNVSFPGTNLRQEVDLNLGYRFAVGDVKLDLGATYFGYPGYDRAPGGFDWSWWEVSLRGSYELAPVKFVGQVSYSPNFNFESGSAWYVEGGFDMTLDFGFTASARLGYQWIEYNTTSPAGHGAFGTPDYAVLSFGLSREIGAGFIGSVTGYYTTLNRNDCFGGLNLCGPRAVATVSRPF
ncbi:TorF family putative porin [Falsiroseomonas sp. CW058]|uniref:TorF family putative porin n=1 Tax=Falsiroseomonas sp. CW058 TaxID=3388664 RepID=UPI003D31C79B